MSHITDVKLRLRHLGDVKAAAEACGGELLEEKRSYNTYYGAKETNLAGARIEHAIRIKGVQYEVGLAKAADGDGWELVYDSWGVQGQALEKALGRGLARLNQEYAVATALRKAKAKLARQGFTAQRENLANGRVRLRLVHR